jgi:hypothetical protein
MCHSRRSSALTSSMPGGNFILICVDSMSASLYGAAVMELYVEQMTRLQVGDRHVGQDILRRDRGNTFCNSCWKRLACVSTIENKSMYLA